MLPMSADRAPKGLGVPCKAHNVVATFAGHLLAYLPLRFDHPNTAQPRPHLAGIEIGDHLRISNRPILALFQSPMSCVLRWVVVMQQVSSLSGQGRSLQVDDILIEGALIGFERQHILAVLLLDLPGNLGMAVHRVDAHDAACHFQLLQQDGQRGLLIGMRFHMALGQDQVARRGPRTHHLHGCLALYTLMGATGRLAINGNLLAGQDFVDGLHRARENTLETALA
jgi:hypothetical protein